jgi:hypothetical protein
MKNNKFTEEEDKNILKALKLKRFYNTSLKTYKWTEIAKYIGTHRQGKDISQRVTRVLLAPKSDGFTRQGLLKLHHIKTTHSEDGFSFIKNYRYFEHSDQQLAYQYNNYVTLEIQETYNNMTEEEQNALMEYNEPFERRSELHNTISMSCRTRRKKASTPKRGRPRRRVYASVDEEEDIYTELTTQMRKELKNVMNETEQVEKDSSETESTTSSDDEQVSIKYEEYNDDLMEEPESEYMESLDNMQLVELGSEGVSSERRDLEYAVEQIDTYKYQDWFH